MSKNDQSVMMAACLQVFGSGLLKGLFGAKTLVDNRVSTLAQQLDLAIRAPDNNRHALQDPLSRQAHKFRDIRDKA